MREKTLHCDQAIYTSIRTPMGDGYRIVAASPGLRPQEKQAITRNSPSLDSICLPPDRSDTEPVGISFYRLATGRLCLSLSRFAGEEHTGRGGQRVYTINIVFDAKDFADCGFNPFRIVRAMVDAGLTEPQLKPDSVLPAVELCVGDDDDLLEGAGLPLTLPEPFGPFILDQTLQGKGLVVDVEDDWTECAEATLLGLPGPMREDLSFSAGLNFSTSRKHTLQFLSDCKGKAKMRCSAIGATFLPSSGAPPTLKHVSDWAAMAALHWRDRRLADLSRRTSRPYDDTSEEARERLAALFAAMDDIPQIEATRLIILAREILNHTATGAEETVCDEFLNKVGESIIARLSGLSAQEIEILFTELVAVWRQGSNATKFSQPVLDALLRKTMMTNPLAAAQLTLQVASDVPVEADRVRHDALLEVVVTQFAAWAMQAHDPALAEVPELIKQWKSVRPDSPELTGVAERCTLALAEMDAAT